MRAHNWQVRIAAAGARLAGQLAAPSYGPVAVHRRTELGKRGGNLAFSHDVAYPLIVRFFVVLTSLQECFGKHHELNPEKYLETDEFGFVQGPI